MSKFIGHLDVRLVDDSAAQGRGLWELLEPLVYQSDVAGRVFTVPAGFRTDFESVPRIPVAFMLLGDRFSRAAAVHDALYSGMFPGVTREMADQVLREAIRVTGGNEFEAESVYLGVRAGGAPHWKT